MDLAAELDPNGVRIAWAPNPGPQLAALECPIDELFYGGARGGGKSDFLLGDFLKQASRWGSRAKGLLVRRHYKELDEIISRSREIYSKIGARFLSSTDALMWIFPPTAWDIEQGNTDGAVLKFRHLKKTEDAKQYQGHSYTWVGVDEAGQFPDPEPIDLLRATMRSPYEAEGLVPVLRLTGNPGGAGHVWLKARYIVGAPGGYVPIRYQPQPELLPDVWATKVFIPSKVSDNPRLDQRQYRMRLAVAALGNKELLKAWLLGDWDVFVGQAFWEWSHEAHVAPNTIQHLRGWRWVAGLDWGVRKGCYVLAALGPEGEVEIVLSLVVAKMDAKTAAAWVARKTRLFPTPEFIFTGEDLWQTSVDRGGKTLAELYGQGMLKAYGNAESCPTLVKVAQGAGSRSVKYSLMHQYLAWQDRRDPDGRILPWALPMLRFQERCDYLTSTIPSLPVDEEKPEEDVDTEADDHGYDACCMVLLSRAHADKAPERDVPQDRAAGFELTDRGRKGRRKRRKRYRLTDLANEGAGEAGYDSHSGYVSARSAGLVEVED